MDRNLRLLLVVVAVNFLGNLTVRPMIPLYAEEALGIDPVWVGLAVAAYAFLPLLFAVPVGASVDRLGAMKLLWWGSVGIAAGTALLVLWPSLLGLVMSQLLGGLAHLLFVVASQAMTARSGRPEDRETNFGYYTFAASLGQFVGPPIGGFLIDVSGFRAAFAAAALLTLAPLPILARLQEEVGAEEAGDGSARAARPGAHRRPSIGLSDVPRLLAHPVVLASMFGSAGVLFGVGVRQSFYPIYLKQVGLTALAIGTLVSARALASMLVRPFVRSVTPYLGRGGLLLASMGLVAAGVAVTPWTARFDALLLAAAVTGIGHGFSQPITMVMVADAVEAREQGLAAGLRLWGNRVSQFLNPMLYGLVATAYGVSATFHLAGIVVVVAAGLAALFLQRSRRAGQAAPSRAPAAKG